MRTFIFSIILSSFIVNLVPCSYAGSLADLGPAPELKGEFQWISSESLTMEQLKGKVVLIDFWTYSCINCIRTLPHVTGWYEKYKDKGFVVIGVHSPEFDFEKGTGNIAKAIKRFNVTYPVVTDNDKVIWQAYDNHYWPAKYLVDANGHIRKTHFGEGDYDEMEEAIRQLLAEAGQPLDSGMVSLEDQTPQYSRTPETYLGQARVERLVSKEEIRGGEQNFTLPPEISQDHFAYEGHWNISRESAKAQKGSALEFRFKADKVFLVISPNAAGDKIKVFIDGEVVNASIAGADVKDGMVTLDQQRLYSLIDLRGKVRPHLLRLEFEDEGISVYAFTFG